jgi:hypothetical protein
MTRSIHVGCAALPPRVSRAAYFAALDYLECSLWAGKPVKPVTWKRWIDESPASSLGLVAPKLPSSQFTAALGDPVGAFVIATPPTFSPSAYNRDRLRGLFDSIVPPDTLPDAARIWQPSGLWDLTTAVKTAETAGVVLSWDPFSDPTVPPEAYEAVAAEAMYWRPAGLGRKGPLSPDHLDRLASLAEAIEQVWIVFATTDAWRDAKRLRDLVQK